MVKVLFLLFLFVSSIYASININRANAAQLQTLNGIGPVKAKEIVLYRKTHGGFKSVDEVVNVKGIGPKTLEKLRPQITVH